MIENAGALDRAQEDIDHVGADALQALKRCGVRVGRHTIFLPGLVRPRAAQTLATLWHWAHNKTAAGFFLPRAGALSSSLDRFVSWGEAAAAGYRVCGRVAVRFDILERLSEALAQTEPPEDAAVARLIGRPVRELSSILQALGYRRVTVEGASHWRFSAPKRKRRHAAPEDNPFATLATLLPNRPQPRRKRRGAA